MTENTALWLSSNRAPLTVGPAPYTSPGAGEIVVRTRALAVNPMDRLTQTVGGLVTPYLLYPFVLGSDVAGEVGPGVARFRVGDRVIGHAVGSDKARNRAAEGAFQSYVVLLAHMASPLPDRLSFEPPRSSRWRCRPPPAACSRTISWRWTRRRPRRARPGGPSWSGVDRPASAATPSSSPSPPAMR